MQKIAQHLKYSDELEILILFAQMLSDTFHTFYINASTEIDFASPFGNEETISAFRINSGSFKLSLVEKIPL